jgi:hypothetical protein
MAGKFCEHTVAGILEGCDNYPAHGAGGQLFDPAQDFLANLKS